jgi:hypothetical protein
MVGLFCEFREGFGFGEGSWTVKETDTRKDLNGIIYRFNSFRKDLPLKEGGYFSVWATCIQTYTFLQQRGDEASGT